MYIAVYPVRVILFASTMPNSSSCGGCLEYPVYKRVSSTSSVQSELRLNRAYSYEEKSLGVFEQPPADEDEEPTLDESISRTERIGKYVGWHLRRQVAFDIWWLVWGIWLILIIERGKIMDEANAPWFNLFRISTPLSLMLSRLRLIASDVTVFEMVSAFGGIGLTLGIPTENYSFSGAFTVTSKLIVIVIMLRGRHRGLPVAIDRASKHHVCFQPTFP